MLRDKDFREALKEGDMDTLRYFFFASGGTKDETKLRNLLDKNTPRLARLNHMERQASFIDLVAYFEMTRFVRLLKKQDWEQIFNIIKQDEIGHLSVFLLDSLELTKPDAQARGICFCAILNCQYVQLPATFFLKSLRVKIKVENDDYIFRPNGVFITALAEEINQRGYTKSALNAIYLVEKVFPVAFWPFLSLLEDVYIEQWLLTNERTESVTQVKEMIKYCYLPC